MNLKRVVITGLGSLTPIGNTVASTWDAMLKGVSGASLITKFDPQQFKCQIACELKGFNCLDHFDRKEANRLDPFAQYSIVAAEEAIVDATLQDQRLNPNRIGVIWGSGIGGVHDLEQGIIDYAQGGFIPRFNPFFIPKMITDIVAGHISIRYGFCGPNYSVTAACASSASAIADACNLIRVGKSDVIVTGGAEAAIIPSGIGGFIAMRALSTRNDDPQTASRPFDLDRDGFVLGEGAACVVLEELDHAKARGAKIYAELVGTGLTADAFHITAPRPEGEGAMEAMRLAVEESGMELSDVDHINTHGTSTPMGNVAEVKAISRLFGDHAENISLNSTKSMTGHLLGAAGCLEAIATIKAINTGLIPPTINHFTDDPQIEPLDFTFGVPTRRTVDFALSNAFGFGGHNVCLAFRKYNG
ncbi:MAG: beta-ketoacyl-ACP synthase II [Bacteroidales bacterium]|nr:beta-ketoacyl-ACP synthase II [Bacteroidales bacterium]